jgi:hypothetical protein
MDLGTRRASVIHGGVWDGAILLTGSKDRFRRGRRAVSTSKSFSRRRAARIVEQA